MLKQNDFIVLNKNNLYSLYNFWYKKLFIHSFKVKVDPFYQSID